MTNHRGAASAATRDELGELSYGLHGVVIYDTSHRCGAPPGAACAPQGRAWG